MKKNILLLIFSLTLFGCAEKRADKKDESILVVRNSGIGFAIDFRDSVHNTSENIYSFFIRSKALPDKQKIETIKELLAFEGDTRKCSNFIVNYNKNLSQFYTGEIENITLEVQSLFLINQIYFDNPFYYAPYSILIDNNSQEEIIQYPGKMRLIFKSYKDWFDLILKYGLAEVKRKNEKPLNYSEFKWIYGIDISPNDPLQFDLNP